MKNSHELHAAIRTILSWFAERNANNIAHYFCHNNGCGHWTCGGNDCFGPENILYVARFIAVGQWDMGLSEMPSEQEFADLFNCDICVAKDIIDIVTQDDYLDIRAAIIRTESTCKTQYDWAVNSGYYVKPLTKEEEEVEIDLQERFDAIYNELNSALENGVCNGKYTYDAMSIIAGCTWDFTFLTGVEFDIAERDLFRGLRIGE